MLPSTKKDVSPRSVMPVIPVPVAAQPPTDGVPDYELQRQEAAQQAARDAASVVRAEGLLANPGQLPFVARIRGLVPAWQRRWQAQADADLRAAAGAAAALVAGTHTDSPEYGGGLDQLELDVERAQAAATRASQGRDRVAERMRREDVEPAPDGTAVGGLRGLTARLVWPILGFWIADFALITTSVYVATAAPNPVEPAVVGAIVATVLTIGAEYVAAGYREYRYHGGRFPVVQVVGVGAVLLVACAVLPYVRSVATLRESSPSEESGAPTLPGEVPLPGESAPELAGDGTAGVSSTGVPLWALFALFLVVMLGIAVGAFLHGYRTPLRLQLQWEAAAHRSSVAKEAVIEARTRLAALVTMVTSLAESLPGTARTFQERVDAVPDHAAAIVAEYYYELGQRLSSPMAWDAMRLLEHPSLGAATDVDSPRARAETPRIVTPDVTQIRQRSVHALRVARASDGLSGVGSQTSIDVALDSSDAEHPPVLEGAQTAVLEDPGSVGSPQAPTDVTVIDEPALVPAHMAAVTR